MTRHLVAWYTRNVMIAVNVSAMNVRSGGAAATPHGAPSLAVSNCHSSLGGACFRRRGGSKKLAYLL